MSFFKLLELISWINHNSISLIIVDVDVHIGAWDSLHLGLWPISKIRSQVNCHILFSHLEVGDGCEHGTVVVVELRSLVLQSNELEALSTDVAPVERAFSDKVEHLLVGMRIVLNSWTHADNNSPGRVGGEDKHWVVNSSELGVHNGLHFMPLIHFQGVVSDRGGQVSSSVTMEAVTIW